jgi:uncharacterized protein (DUF58 family)
MALRILVRPGRAALVGLAACALGALAALLLGAAVVRVATLAAFAVALLLLLAAVDFHRSRAAWRRSAPRLTRRLPSAFAIGVARTIELAIDTGPGRDWHCELYDHHDGSLRVTGLPLTLQLAAQRRLLVAYRATPTRRGAARFAPAQLRIRSLFGLCELLERLGEEQVRRIYPDFAQVARYAWLAGDRRLQEIGIKTCAQRGAGTDFKQLAEYRHGDPVRHIDWKATQRHGKPVLREFQDERDQNILLLIDCGRRMRADDTQEDCGIGAAHFDQVLNAVMLLAYVALQHGDAVGALTFGTPPAQVRAFAPRKGSRALNALMGELYALQPSPTHSDYVAAAQELLRRHRKRALVVVITNFRDEDSSELAQALRLLRSRHLVLLASLRERIVADLQSQPLTSGDAAIDVASAHLFEQARRDAFNRLAARDALMVDAVPERLGVELVNRYHAAKRAGAI